MPRRPTVAIVNRIAAQYRRTFYELLRCRLDDLGIDLVLVLGQPSSTEASKRDCVPVPWAIQTRNTTVRLGDREVCWQPCLRHVLSADLVVVHPEARNLVNYVLFALHAAGRLRLASWGVGISQVRVRPSNRLAEFLKRQMARRVHWWFAYTNRSARDVLSCGFSPKRITVVNNAIDTRGLAAANDLVTDSEVRRLRSLLGIEGHHVGVFVGGMVEDKRVPFLLESCLLVRRKVPDFEMILLGAGADQRVAEMYAERHPWIHYVGPVFGDSRVPFFRLAQLALQPGNVGLVVLDCLALQTPLITSAVPYHGPEIEYLSDGVNGLVVSDWTSPQAYASVVAETFQSPTRIDRLRRGCRETRGRYTVEGMVDRFAEGVVEALRST